MSSNLVIAAIPDENDRVWGISSEKIPHMTLLFLGDANKVANLEQIMLFVEHAANTSLNRFYLTVDRRGKLGDDEADVVFFKKDRYDFKAVRDFRSLLLKDSNIKTAYDSSTQFETPEAVGVPGQPWIPHLTLGYPTTPAKKLPDLDSSIYSVSFNKIAVWTGNFEGPDFLLNDYCEEFDEMYPPIPMDVAMSSLTHAKVSDTPWSQFKDSDYDDAQYARACLLDRGEAAGTAKQRYGLPVREPNGTVNRNACHAAAAVLSSKGGTGSARGNKVKGTPEQIAAAKKKLISLYKNTLQEDVPEGLGGEMKQTTDLGAEFLSHHGVKGMRWGVRQDRQGRGRFDPKGHSGKADVAKLLLPAPTNIPAMVRLGKRFGANRNAKALAKSDQRWKTNLETSTKKAVEVHNTAADEMDRKLPAFNNDKRWAGMDLTKNPPKQKEYDDAYFKEIANPAYARASIKVHGSTSPGGRYKFEIKDHATATMKVTDTQLAEKEAKHAATDDDFDYEFDFNIVRDDNGHISGFKWPDSMGHSVLDLGSEFVLSHYGTLGMRWGHRKTPPVAAPTVARSIVPSGTKNKTKIQTEGGENHDASPDAIKVAQARVKLAKSGTHALSNAELREVANRLQLEQQVKQLSTPAATKFVTGLLKSEGQQSAGRVIRRKAMARGF